MCGLKRHSWWVGGTPNATGAAGEPLSVRRPRELACRSHPQRANTRIDTRQADKLVDRQADRRQTAIPKARIASFRGLSGAPTKTTTHTYTCTPAEMATPRPCAASPSQITRQQKMKKAEAEGFSPTIQ